MRSVLLLLALASTQAFTAAPTLKGVVSRKTLQQSSLALSRPALASRPRGALLRITALADTDATVIGGAGVLASCVMLWSEYTLKTTGCGLPAGPSGLLGALEGISYLFVVGLVAWSVFTKVKTGSGLPAGPGGVLGAAEGLGFLAVLAGVVVLGFQVVDYGYIPNPVPVEGGKCT